MRGKWGNKIIGTAAALGLVLLSQAAFKAGTVEAAGVTLSNPRIEKDDRMEAKQKVTYDCVWFGSYPQAEVIPSQVYTALNNGLRREGDVFVSSNVYHALQKAVNWNANDEIILDGVKYRRMRQEDATYVWTNNEDSDISSEDFYSWSNVSDYHYFRYEPIKWRVLHTDGKQALLLADVALDNQKYDIYEWLDSDYGDDYAERWGEVTWKGSTIRSWLNGYGSGDNKRSIDYRQKNFINSAFNTAEQMAITNTALENVDNTAYKTEGNTVDKIFLLSESEICNTDKAKSYGFIKEGEYVSDEARASQSSTYAKAMGAYSRYGSGVGYWWLRSSGVSKDEIDYVDMWGGFSESLHKCNHYKSLAGVRAVLNLNLSNTKTYSYAGTVCTDGTMSDGGQKVAIPDKKNNSGIPISKLKITAKKGKKKIVITTIKGAKIKLSLSQKCIKKGKKLVKSTTVSAKKNKKGKVTIALKKALKKKTKVTVTVSKAGYKTKKKTIKVS